MKKILNLASLIVLALSVALCGISVVFPSLTIDALDDEFSLVIFASASLVVCGVVGAFLIYSKNDIAKRIGHGMYIATFVLLFALALNYIGRTGINGGNGAEETKSSVAAIMAVIAFIFCAVFYVLQAIKFILNKGVNEASGACDDSAIARVREWKKLLDEGIINEEEFEEKRVDILGLTKK